MDGNGRWAKAQGKSRQYGHKVGSSKVYEVFKLCAELGCKSATFFAMSSENMLRSVKETEYISTLLKSSIECNCLISSISTSYESIIIILFCHAEIQEVQHAHRISAVYSESNFLKKKFCSHKKYFEVL